MTSQKLQMSLFEESDMSILSVADFRAKLSALRETDEVSKIHEVLSFLKLHASHLFSDQSIYSLRTSQGSSVMMGGLRSRQSSERWMTSGMTWNGKCLTQRILEFPKVARGCSLLDILEEQVDETYFLSEELASKLMSYKDTKLTPLQQDTQQAKVQERMCMRVNSRKEAIPILTPDRLEKRQNGRRFKNAGEPMFTLTAQDRHGIMLAGNLPGNHDQNSRVYDPDGLAPTLSTMQGGGQEPKIIQKARGYNEGGSHDIAPTLTGNSWHENNVLEIKPDYRIRKLTPRECWRLQGFPDWAFDRANDVNSNSQLYKQAGNSVTVPVIVAIAERFREELAKYEREQANNR